MIGRSKPLLTGKMDHDAGMEAMKRVKAGEPVERVARRYRRDPGFIEGMIAHYESDLPNFLSPYMQRSHCSPLQAAGKNRHRRLLDRINELAVRRGWIS